MFNRIRNLIAAQAAGAVTTPKQADINLLSDEDYWDVVVPERFDRVVETQSHIIGYSQGKVAARIKKPECQGVTHDWDAGIDIDCPDHPGVFCPGGTSTFYR